MYAWLLSLALYNVEMITTTREKCNIFAGFNGFWSFWPNKIDVATTIFFFVAFVLRVKPNDTMNGLQCRDDTAHVWSVYVTALAATLAVGRVMAVMCTTETLGQIFMALLAMSQDIKKIIVLLIFLLVTFSVCAFVLLQSTAVSEPDAEFVVSGNGDMGSTFLSLTWSIFDPFVGDVTPPSNNPFFILFTIVFLFIVEIVVINLLIAMMNKTYANITYIDWYFHRVKMTNHYKIAPLFPPPLNLLTFLPTFLARMCQDAKERQAGHDIFDRCPPNYEAKLLHKNDRARRQRRKVVDQYFKKRWRAEKEHQEMLDKASMRMESKGSAHHSSDTRERMKKLKSVANVTADHVQTVDWRIAKLTEATTTRFNQLNDQTRERFENLEKKILGLHKLLKVHGSAEPGEEVQQQQLSQQQPSNTEGGGGVE